MTTIESSDALLFVVVFTALLMRLLLSPPIWHHGEAREALVARAIVQDHQWILPYRNGELPSKPPLFHWFAALAEILAGQSDITVRLPSVMGAEIMAIATFLLGRAMGGKRTAWLAVGALLGMHEFWHTATQARVDMIFSACITMSLAGFFLWFCNGSKVARATCYIASAFAVLAKGPAGLALPGLVILGFLLVDGRFRMLRTFWSWPLAGFVLLVDFGWYALAYHIGGNEFLQLQVQHENIERALGTGGFSSNSNFFTMLGWFITRMLPWNLALFWSVVRRARGESEDSAGRFLHAWWIGIFLVFALAAGKRAVYLLPIYPAIALLAARAMDRMIVHLPRLLRFRHSRPSAAFAADKRRLLLQGSRALAVAILLFDVTLMLVSRDVWRDLTLEKSRLAFADQVSAILPAHAALFAAPELDNTDVTVIAYHLGREIRHRPIPCGDRNDYYLSPLDSAQRAGDKSRALVSSEKADIVLIALLSPSRVPLDSSCTGPSLQSIPYGDD